MPNAKAVDKLCDDIMSVCLSANKFSQSVNTAFKLAEEAEKEFLLRRDFSKGNSPARSVQFTDFLIEKIYA
ncbi:hypothetical protein Xant_14265 [Xanthomonas cissicola]|uniref:Uncharacterized protein n=2 Tax=Xanthomonas cissicola TaxID=86186 RepID=A0ABX3LUN5_9XANT|nr:hypothetical protein Xant_14265 [Xanthomonas cissicola]